MKAWFVHGWGFGPTVWDPLTGRLPEFGAVLADRGYFGPAEFAPPAEPAVWITHSFGTMMALGVMDDSCRALIAINGFDRFVEADGYAGVPTRLIERMIRRFDDDTALVLADFRLVCGEKKAVKIHDAEALRSDLSDLRQINCRSVTEKLAIPILSLHGTNDPILPPKMRRETLNGTKVQRAECEGAGHLLPLSDVDWCAGRITQFLAEVAE